jgi:deoxyribodipyrimidine photo-lyase
MIRSLFPPTRAAALARLRDFVPNAGARYAHGRNTDTGPGAPSATSLLSPYVRRRLITEEEVVAAVLSAHSVEAAEKFVQEVVWRTYWKGWLEQRPSVWVRFVAARESAPGIDLTALADAEAGRTGIEGFDDWARELRATGYLHNHARMWFASIWIFTLRLPWERGADFFLRHLLDADPASNTLSWRWVAGLQTVGKTYLATTDNIARFTQGRFAPRGLAREATALTEPPLESPQPLPRLLTAEPATPALLLLTEEDLQPDGWLTDPDTIRATLIATDRRFGWGDAAQSFTESAVDDLATRLRADGNNRVTVARSLDAPTLRHAAAEAGVRRIVTPYAPVGPVADRLAAVTAELALEGITVERVRRDWDSRFWPYATKGYFAFKTHLPQLLREIGYS